MVRPLIWTAWEMTSGSYCGGDWSRRKSVSFETSSSDVRAPWTRRGLPIISVVRRSMSPLPRSFSAPTISSITRESIWLPTAKAMRPGMLALMRPVMILTSGR